LYKKKKQGKRGNGQKMEKNNKRTEDEIGGT
jgi:hypothetical protein